MFTHSRIIFCFRIPLQHLSPADSKVHISVDCDAPVFVLVRLGEVAVTSVNLQESYFLVFEIEPGSLCVFGIVYS